MINLIKNFFGLEKTQDQIAFESLIESMISKGSYSIEQSWYCDSIVFLGTLDNKTIEYRRSDERGNCCFLSIDGKSFDAFHLMTLKSKHKIGHEYLKQIEKNNYQKNYIKLQSENSLSLALTK